MEGGLSGTVPIIRQTYNNRVTTNIRGCGSLWTPNDPHPLMLVVALSLIHISEPTGPN